MRSVLSSIKHCLIPLCLLLLCLSIGVHAQQPSPDNAEQIEHFAEDLVSAKSDQERANLLASRKELVSTDLRKQLVKHGNMKLAGGEYASALNVYSMVQEISNQIGDKEGIAASELNIGTVCFFQGNYSRAIQYYGKARELFSEIGNKAEAARALFGVGLANKESGDNKAALDALEKAHKEFELLYDTQEVSNTLTAIGSIYYSQGDYAAASKVFLTSANLSEESEDLIHVADAFYMQADYGQALVYYEKALSQSQGNPAILVSGLGSAANSYYYQGNYEQALNYYQKALALSKRLGDISGVATQLQGIGNVQRAQGDFGAALDSYFKSLETASTSPIKLSTAATLGSIGLIRAMQSDNENALAFYRRSLEQFESNGDKVGTARMLSNVGNVYFAQGLFDKALDAYRQSLALREAMGDKSSSANILAGMGTTYLAMRNYSAAQENLDRALALFRAIGNKAAIADVLTRIADTDFGRGEFEQVLSVSKEAADLAQDTESFGTLWYALTQTGKAQRALNQTEQAAAAVASAMKVVESARLLLPAAELTAEKSGTLPSLTSVELLIDQNKAGDAFESAERAKLIALREILRLGKITTTLSAQEQGAEATLSNKLVSLSVQLDREEEHGRLSEAALERLRNERRTARSDLEAFIRKLYANHPQLKVARGEIDPITATDAAILVENEKSALLEFSITGNNLFLFVLTREQQPSGTKPGGNRKLIPTTFLKAYPLNITANELTDQVRSFHELIQLKDSSLGQAAQKLYSLLLKPAEEQLLGKSALTIVPDGALWGLPFEALQPAAESYLIDERSISYVPSFSAWREIRKLRDRKLRDRPVALVVGAPSVTKESLDRLKVTYDGDKLDTMVASEKEIESVKSIYGRAGQGLNGSIATEDRLKRELSRANVIHLATPVILDDRNPMYSAAILSSSENRGPEDGLLYAWETMRLDSPARLVVLSTSKIARRQSGVGNAAIGMAWAWFVAGTPTVLLSRWQDESSAVEQLMSQFHRRIKAKRQGPLTTSDALRQSVLLLKSSTEYQHPFFWSGFSVLGDSR